MPHSFHDCIQESNLNCSSSFRIPGYASQRSESIYSRSTFFVQVIRALAVKSNFRQAWSMNFLLPSPQLTSNRIHGDQHLSKELFSLFPKVYVSPLRIVDPTLFLPPLSFLLKSFHSGRLQLSLSSTALKRYSKSSLRMKHSTRLSRCSAKIRSCSCFVLSFHQRILCVSTILH